MSQYRKRKEAPASQFLSEQIQQHWLVIFDRIQRDPTICQTIFPVLFDLIEKLRTESSQLNERLNALFKTKVSEIKNKSHTDQSFNKENLQFFFPEIQEQIQVFWQLLQDLVVSYPAGEQTVLSALQKVEGLISHRQAQPASHTQVLPPVQNSTATLAIRQNLLIDKKIKTEDPRSLDSPRTPGLVRPFYPHDIPINFPDPEKQINVALELLNGLGAPTRKKFSEALITFLKQTSQTPEGATLGEAYSAIMTREQLQSGQQHSSTMSAPIPVDPVTGSLLSLLPNISMLPTSTLIQNEKKRKKKKARPRENPADYKSGILTFTKIERGHLTDYFKDDRLLFSTFSRANKVINQISLKDSDIQERLKDLGIPIKGKTKSRQNRLTRNVLYLMNVVNNFNDLSDAQLEGALNTFLTSLTSLKKIYEATNLFTKQSVNPFVIKLQKLAKKYSLSDLEETLKEYRDWLKKYQKNNDLFWSAHSKTSFGMILPYELTYEQELFMSKEESEALASVLKEKMKPSDELELVRIVSNWRQRVTMNPLPEITSEDQVSGKNTSATPEESKTQLSELGDITLADELGFPRSLSDVKTLSGAQLSPPLPSSPLGEPESFPDENQPLAFGEEVEDIKYKLASKNPPLPGVRDTATQKPASSPEEQKPQDPTSLGQSTVLPYVPSPAIPRPPVRSSRILHHAYFFPGVTGLNPKGLNTTSPAPAIPEYGLEYNIYRYSKPKSSSFTGTKFVPPPQSASSVRRPPHSEAPNTPLAKWSVEQTEITDAPEINVKGISYNNNDEEFCNEIREALRNYSDQLPDKYSSMKPEIARLVSSTATEWSIFHNTITALTTELLSRKRLLIGTEDPTISAAHAISKALFTMNITLDEKYHTFSQESLSPISL